MNPARWWFFVAARYDSFSGQLISEVAFYTNAHPEYADDPERWGHRFASQHFFVEEGHELVVRRVSRSEFNALDRTQPHDSRRTQA